MAPSKLRKAIGAVKDQTSISLAKVGNNSSISDLDVTIVKATRHEEFPADERHIREILSLTCYSRAHISACVNTISRRLNKTKNWVVALKTLILIHRLLAEGDPAYEEEIFFSTRRGTRILNMIDFRDTSRSDSWDYSAFVRTYSLYLDERLDFRMQGRRGKRSSFGVDAAEVEESSPDQAESQPSHKATPVKEMKVEQMFTKMQHLMQMLERFLACRPTGGAKSHRIVFMALYPVVKESFQIYHEMIELMANFVDKFMQMDISDNVKVYEMFCRVSKQFEELESFYAWSKDFGVARPSEYPEVEKITTKRLEVMDELIRDKKALAEGEKGNKEAEEEVKEEQQPKDKPEAQEEEDPNAIKALPAPEEEAPEEIVQDEPKEEETKPPVQMEADLLNLGDDYITSEEHGDKLALALFDGAGVSSASSATGPPAWEAFPSGSSDWENALVQSASHLQNQGKSFGGGFDMTMLDGMYQHGAMIQASAGIRGSGSASSMAFGSAGRPAMLALPAPPTQNGSTTPPGGDPFAASLAVAPPAYVQMSEMARKQKLLMDEQLMWQQYAGMGRQVQAPGLPYNAGYFATQY